MASLKRAFLIYVINVLKLPEKYPVPNIEKMSEVTMLRENVERWYEEHLQEGREKGIKEGIKEGIQKGIEEGILQSTLQHQKILSLLTKKALLKNGFHFSLQQQNRLENASIEELQNWLEKIIENNFTTAELL